MPPLPSCSNECVDLPVSRLFVADAARLTEAYYDRDVERFCSTLESSTNVEFTGQELILSDVYNRLSAQAVATVSAIAHSRCTGLC